MATTENNTPEALSAHILSHDRDISKLRESIESLETVSASDEDSFRLIRNRIEMIEAHPMVEIPPDRTELYKALVAAQLEIRNADQNVDNEFLQSKYADLASVMDAVREPLAKNGLAIIQLTATIEEVKTVETATGAIGIKTILVHESGQTITDITAMVPPKMDPQGIGSCRTYMRRYAVLAICAIAGAIDDDAEGTKTDPNDYERITDDEIDSILATADELFSDRADWVIQQMCEKTFDVTHVSQIKAGEADLAIKRLKNTARREKAKAKKGVDVKPSPKPPKEREPGEDDDKVE